MPDPSPPPKQDDDAFFGTQQAKTELEGLEGLDFSGFMTDQEITEQAIAEEKYQSMKQDRTERKLYANHLFWLVVGWLIVGLIVTVLSAFHVEWVKGQSFTFSLKISDPVVLALIGSTTVNVLGLFYVVAKYLFPSERERSEK